MNSPRQSKPITKWLPVGAAGGLLAAVIVAGVISGAGNDGDAVDEPTVPESSRATAAPSVPIETIDHDAQVVTDSTDFTDSTDVAVDKVPLDRTLTDGVTGDDVEMVQARLGELGFDPGPADGIYGPLTQQAVWAFEKLVMDIPREQATGQVTPEMWDEMQDPVTVQPRRPTGGLANHVEIYLPEQVMIIFHADEPELIAHVSSGELDENGEPAWYCEKATWDTDGWGNEYDEPRTGEACAYAKTPGGVFTIDRMVEGKRTSPLGGMMNPAYFNYGIAIHGADNVPLHPASHGCIRINQHLGGYFQDLVANGDRVLVWNGQKEPEEITDDESLPSFDQRTYDTTTTTSTTTSTTTTTTSTSTTSTTVPGTTPPESTPPTDTSTTSTSHPSTTSAPKNTEPQTPAPPITDPGAPDGE